MEENFDSMKKQIKNKVAMLIDDNKIDEAYAVIREYLEIVPNDVEAFSMEAVILMMNAQFDKAELVLKNGLQIDNNYFDLNYNLAFLYENLNKYNESVLYYERALDITNDESTINEINEKISIITKDHRVDLNLIQQSKNKSGIIRKVLFIQSVPCIRTNKVAKALSQKGIQVDILYSSVHPSQVYKNLKLPYKNIYQLQNVNEMIDFINDSDYDILYSSNEPDYLTVLFTATNKPIIHDTHDMMSLRSDITNEQIVLEYIANVKSAGNIYVNPMIRDIAVNKFNLKNKPILSLHSYIEEEQLPLKYYEKLSNIDGQIHCVFEGGLHGTIGHHRYLEPIFLKLAENNIHVHLHCPVDENYINKLLKKSKYIHYEGVTSPQNLIVEMTKYDIGLAIFNLTERNKTFLDTAFPNKIWDYLAASLPIMFADLISFKQFAEENGVGKVLNLDGDIKQQFKDVMDIKIDKNFLINKKWTMNRAAANIIKFLVCVKNEYYLDKEQVINSNKGEIKKNKYERIIQDIRKTYDNFKLANRKKVVLIGTTDCIKKNMDSFSAFIISKTYMLDKVDTIELNDINSVNYDYIIIDTGNNLISDEIKRNLINSGIPTHKIILWESIIFGLSNIEGFNFKLNKYMEEKNFETIITGLSYAESGIDIDYLDKSTFNFALSGQDLYYDYKILKYIIEKRTNDSLRHVVINLAYYSFGYDLSKSNNKFRVQRYYDIFKDTHNNPNINEVKLLSKMYLKCENNLKYESYCKELFNGIVEKNMYNNVFDEIKKQSNMMYSETIKENINIFERILEMLNYNNIKATIVILPVTKYYQNAYEYKQRDIFYDILNSFKNKYIFEVMDYFQNNDFEDNEFYDFSHLNLRGAKKFTILLNEHLNKK
ncbi:hypothetical protein D2A34_02085 [Clostridium chromiireducens]|uniref:Uncharacterized protein n=1 Tax=Clostridium chromiireducens TaxID=225345 RepID=A0A399ISY8_9CLOT|nr:hypothetical protein [Clostridium chromiireducens]RII36188.1 hypothetical protein D2A34_02085 [Clostridium chromiireducens]